MSRLGMSWGFVRRGLLRVLLAAVALPAPAGIIAAGEVAVTILHTNDIHQHLERLPHIAAHVADYRRRHPDTVFVDAGDFFDRGSSLVPLTRGEAVFAAMSLMGYDFRILGNHDWSYGADRVRELIAACPGTFLGTNLATLQPPLPANLLRIAVKEFRGIRLGFLGITLDSYGNAKSRPELYVLNAQEETARAVAELQPRADVIVAVTHLGLKTMDHEIRRACPTDMDLVRANPGVQVVVGAHTHTLISPDQTRRIYDETGRIVVQAGHSGEWIGRLTLWIDESTRRIGRFEVEHVDTSKLDRTDARVARYLREQYDRYMPNAAAVLGQFAETMEFYNLAYWYADFLRHEAGADVALVPRKCLYDEPKSFPRGPVTVERLFGYVHDRYLVRARVRGSDLLSFCRSDAVRDRFNPFHHQGRPYSGDAIYSSGLAASYRPDTRTVDFAIDPARTYTLVAPWPFDAATARQYRAGLPVREAVEPGNFLPGLKTQDAAVLPATSRQLLVSAGMKDGLKFTRRYPGPDPQWDVWTSHFEEKLRWRESH